MVPRASKQKNTDATAYTPWPGASVTTLDFSESFYQDRAIPFRAFFLMHYIGLCIRISNVDGTTRVQTIKTPMLRHTHPGPGQAIPLLTFPKAPARTAQFPLEPLFLMHHIGLCIGGSNVDGATRVQTIKTPMLRHTHPGRGKRYHTGLFRKLLPGPRNSL